jgi:hypothetical protein
MLLPVFNNLAKSELMRVEIEIWWFVSGGSYQGPALAVP